MFCFWDLFPHLGLHHPASIWWLLPYSILSCFVIYGCHLLEACSYLKRKCMRNGSGREWRWEGAWRSGGGEPVIRFIIWEKNPFSVRNNKIKDFINFILYVWIFIIIMDVHHMCSVPVEGIRRYHILWNWNYKC